MKKFLPIIIAVIIVLILGIGGFLIIKSKKTSAPSTSKPQEEAIIETPLEERPYVTLTPRADGKEFTMDIGRIKNTQTVEYELVYLSQGLSRGVIGSIDLKGETNISRKLLLGTCSKNVCKYDEGVTEGTLTLRFRGPEGTRKFTTSIDGKFKLTGKLSGGAFYMTTSTVGLPKEIEGKIIAGPYGVFTSGSETIKNGKANLTLSEKPSLAKLYSWDGKDWNEEKSAKVEEEIISTPTDILGTFIAVSP
ncbi:MAG: Uncharacterized protein LiPW31_133 [Microgenomates group bacterium LiPW_31]|nr:MAG: Uncharacterized protein LiPW31_133 [Microgenomates group bacterium LiPW_31]